MIFEYLKGFWLCKKILRYVIFSYPIMFRIRLDLDKYNQ